MSNINYERNNSNYRHPDMHICPSLLYYSKNLKFVYCSFCILFFYLSTFIFPILFGVQDWMQMKVQQSGALKFICSKILRQINIDGKGCFWTNVLKVFKSIFISYAIRGTAQVFQNCVHLCCYMESGICTSSSNSSATLLVQLEKEPLPLSSSTWRRDNAQ